MRANTIKCPMGALTAEGALIYDENVSGKRPAVLLAPNWLGIAAKRCGEASGGPQIVTWFSSPTSTAPERGWPISGAAAAVANPLR